MPLRYFISNMIYIAFDFETTGFLPGIDQIVEIGAIRFEDEKPLAAFTTLINPNRAMPEAASRVNGITDKMLVGKPKISDVLDSFAEFCGSDILVAHNAPFDFQFLDADIRKFESNSPTGFVLDTCAMSRKVLPGLANYKLGTLVKHLNIESSGFHRAEEDASYCGQLFWHLVKKISNSGQAPAIENLIALSNNSKIKFPIITRKPKQLDFLAELT